jgi:hypothetical protein
MTFNPFEEEFDTPTQLIQTGDGQRRQVKVVRQEAQCCRLLDRCVADAGTGNPVEVRQAMDVLFGLLDQIDECRDDIVFFADEAGSWQVSVVWETVLPAWFKVLSATTGPEEYASPITKLLSRHYRYGRDEMLVVARRTATPEQRKALAKF